MSKKIFKTIWNDVRLLFMGLCDAIVVRLKERVKKKRLQREMESNHLYLDIMETENQKKEGGVK